MLLLSLGLGRLLPHSAGHPSDEPLMKVPTGWNKGFPCGSAVMSLTAHEGDAGLMYGWEDPLEKDGNPLQYSCLEIPWSEETGELYSKGLERAGHDVAIKQQQSETK